MPRSQLIRMECDYCTQFEIFDLTSGDQNVIIPKLQKWLGLVKALDPAGPNAPDSTKWYDSADCVTRGMKRDAEALELERKVGASV